MQYESYDIVFRNVTVASFENGAFELNKFKEKRRDFIPELELAAVIDKLNHRIVGGLLYNPLVPAQICHHCAF